MASTSEIIEAAKSLAGCKAQESAKMVSFFSDPDNQKAIAEAYDKRGSYPPKNRASYHKGVGFLGKWYDFCDFEPIFDFYNYAKISVEYPKPSRNQAESCGDIKTALVGLESAKQTAIASGDTLYKKAIDIKISEYNSIYASLDCDQYILDQERIKTEEAIKRQGLFSSQLAAEAFKDATDDPAAKGAKTGSYVLYGFVGLSAIIFLTVLLKKN
jgi:hypothetical protein